MKTVRPIVVIALLGSLSMLTACGADKAPDDEVKQQKTSVITRAIDRAIVEAREELKHENISISEGKKNLPKAEITPKGDFLIEGRAVAINDAQRALLLEYRGHVITVAERGMEIGAQGADLATKAMGETFKGLVLGKSEKEIEDRVEGEAVAIKQAAAELCKELPPMIELQHKLAATLPEFKPYATMTQEDIDDCYKDSDEESAKTADKDSDNEAMQANAAEEAAAAGDDSTQSK